VTTHRFPLWNGLELRVSPIAFGPAAPGLEFRVWTNGRMLPTPNGFILPATDADAVTAAIRKAVKEACMGPLFAPVPEVRQ
jgi:hypothetical protein